ncbi:MAG: protein YkgL [Escherichia coli]
MQAASQREETEWRVQSKRELMPAYRGAPGQQVNINIMEYSERNVRQLALNEQEEYIPRKINAGVINTPTLIRSDY